MCMLESLDAMRKTFDSQRAQSLKAVPRSLEEVLVMASYLGLPYGGDVGSEHLWIADAALCPQIPIGWVQHVDHDSDLPFYRHLNTGDVMWEHPQISFLRGAVSVVNEATAAMRAASSAARAVLDKRTAEGPPTSAPP